jgi:hypothetical protein
MQTIFNFESPDDLLGYVDHYKAVEISKTAEKEISKGVSVVIDLFQKLSIHIDPEKFWKEFFQSTAGMFFDIGLVCAGDPECWFDPQQSFSQGSFASHDPDDERQIIKLGFNATAPLEFSKISLIEKGAAVVVLTYLLEQSGRSVSITQFYGIERNNQQICGSLLIKPADHPLNMEMLLHWLVCPDAIQLFWSEISKRAVNAKNLGILDQKYPFPITDHGMKESDSFIKGLFGKEDNWSQAKSISWIQSELEKLDINFNF